VVLRCGDDALQVYQRRVHGLRRGSRAERNITRTKTKIVRMLAVVFVTFGLSWLPLYVVGLRLLFTGSDETTVDERRALKKYALPVAQWLGAANSAANPCIYCYFSASFRSAVREALCRAPQSRDAAAAAADEQPDDG